MIVEVLYPNLCNLFGDRGNVVYLKKCLTKAKFIETSIDDEPYFVKHKVDLIYMGPASEKSQEIIISKLLPYKNKLNKLIDNNTAFLLTGNAMEIFGKQIIDKDGTIINGLDLIDLVAHRDMFGRISSIFLGKYEDLDFVGFQSQFTLIETKENKIIDKKYGIGLNNDNYGAIIKNSLIATPLLGPILVMNPLFTKRVLKLEKLPYEEDLMKAYEIRLSEFINIANR